MGEGSLRPTGRSLPARPVLVPQPSAQPASLADTRGPGAAAPGRTTHAGSRGARTVSADVPVAESPSVASCSARVPLKLSRACPAHVLSSQPARILRPISSHGKQVLSSSSRLQALFFSYQVVLRSGLPKIPAPFNLMSINHDLGQSSAQTE